jgi:hypothetical protein
VNDEGGHAISLRPPARRAQAPRVAVAASRGEV